jgi:hypothetical protein
VEGTREEMPFVRIYNSITNLPEGFIWRIRDDEEISMPLIMNSKRLIITQEYASTWRSLKVPSLDVFNATGTLDHLEIWDLDVADMPRIPDSVTTLEIRNTTMTDLRQINANWGNIDTLILEANSKLRGTVNVPDGVKDFAILNQMVGIIRFPEGLKRVRCGPHVRFTQFVGSMPSDTLYLVSTYANPYKKGLMDMEELCENEIRYSLPMYDEIITQKWHFRMMKLIEGVNKCINYKVCAELGSIPKRIRVSEDNFDNPIVVAMNLSSNYPRRMAEFVAEVTTVN